MDTLIVYQGKKRIAYTEQQAMEYGFHNVRDMARKLFQGHKIKIVSRPSAREEAYKNMSNSKTGRITKHALV
jgi:hypothetical protein